MTGEYELDTVAAVAQEGLTGRPPKDYQWHHVDNDPATGIGLVELVVNTAHRGLHHRGRVKDYQDAHGTETYDDSDPRKRWPGGS